ncbi:molybdate ABC transporter substrate-binding protein [Prescottella soli]|uniref:Molybdate ABC transporter substrate-binding protein n=1 Tax=Prescottella soli TaxID=1543852 RepID=A0ABW9FY90_9NOCA
MRVAVVALVAVLATAVAGCSSGETEAVTQPGTEPGTQPVESITVFAAASLRSTFTELGRRFEASHPGTRVVFNFGGSSDLFTQLDQGAPGDVFASADTANMTKARGAGLTATDPVNFATNVLTIAVPPGNPANITSFADLARPGVNVVVCAPQVPCGTATRRVADAAGVRLSPVSEESSVTDVFGKVVTGQADAGLVYVTDVAGADGKVTGIPFPEAVRVVNTYPIAVLNKSEHRDVAGEFVALVIGPEGRRVLSDAGFGTP